MGSDLGINFSLENEVKNEEHWKIWSRVILSAASLRGRQKQAGQLLRGIFQCTKNGNQKEIRKGG